LLTIIFLKKQAILMARQQVNIDTASILMPLATTKNG
jgi:hypothetical protein